MVRSRKCNLEAVVGALAFLLTTASAASAVPVSLPVNAVINSVGQTTVVNITIGSAVNVEGLGLSITYSEAVADVLTVGNVQRGPLTQACDSAIINIADPGRLTITAACFSTPISGSGTLFSVTFTGTGNGVTPLTFSTLIVMGEVLIPNGCLLNEGSPTCEPMNGQLTVGQAVPTSTATRTATLAAVTGTATNTPINTATRTNTVPGATATNTVAPATATNSPTRSSTPTVTDTPTTGPSPTASNTTTPVNTGTVTQTPSITGTATDTPTPEPTGTITATRTITSTGTVTRTRPGIPVVPSPLSPAGAAMISGLAVAMVWALRRLYRP